MESISERVKKIIDYKKLSVLKFEKNIDTGNNSIGTAIRRNSNLSGNILSKILNVYPEISPSWLLTGKGEMLLKDENTALVKEKEPSQVEGLKEKIAFLEQAIKDKEKIIGLQEDKIEKYRLEIEKLKQKVKQLKESLEKKNAYSKSVGAGTSLSAKPPADKSSVITGKKNIENPQRPRKSS